MSVMEQGTHSLIELLETIADNKYVLGDRLVEVGVSGPNLEATLSAIAMAQGELGHARLLYNWCFDLKGVKGKKPDIQAQTGKAFQTAVNVQNWISLIASLYAINAAIDIVFQTVLKTSHSKVASRIQKLVREQHDHIIYAENWAKQLLLDQGAVPYRFQEALREAAEEAKAWLAKVEKSEELKKEGYFPETPSFAEKFEKRLQQLNAEQLVQAK
ncbi:Phenylacetic acid catabolic protein [Aeribacillus pallidus]